MSHSPGWARQGLHREESRGDGSRSPEGRGGGNTTDVERLEEYQRVRNSQYHRRQVWGEAGRVAQTVGSQSPDFRGGAWQLGDPGWVSGLCGLLSPLASDRLLAVPRAAEKKAKVTKLLLRTLESSWSHPDCPVGWKQIPLTWEWAEEQLLHAVVVPKMTTCQAGPGHWAHTLSFTPHNPKMTTCQAGPG
ncbi:hypothetical protein P7K49_039382 [Saguinus oedipus]|uniref:Uncharacterized protein n=1 Tax=Saguinus oedipus TaxID=9490 RepID=A0ABQ9TBN1_SAGOE|nr:hypothetical protein P7K49_039382 [Saguinus oedipus]